MVYTVSTFQELLDAISAVTDESTITLSSDIELTSAVEINTTENIHFDLNENSITTSVDNVFTITSGTVDFSNGIINSIGDTIISIVGTANATLHSDLVVFANNGSVAKVGKKGQLTISGAEITCNADATAIFVEGYTNSLTNSKLTMTSGYLNSKNTAIEVTKKGIVEISGGSISANNDIAIVRGDSTATKVSITKGNIHGSFPEDAVDTSISDMEDAGYGDYIIKEKSTDSVIEDTPVEETPVETTDNSDTVETSVESADAEESDSESIQPIIEDTQVEPKVTPAIEPEVAPVPTQNTSDTESIAAPVDPPVAEDTVEPQNFDTDDTSTVFYDPTLVYVIPSFTRPMTTIIGAVNILGGTFIDPVTNDIYTKISFKLPGNGKKAIGYVIASKVEKRK